MLPNSSWMVTYMTPWSPIGYMEDAINHDCRMLEARRCACWVPKRSAEGQEASYGGGPPRKGHQVLVKATDGEICPPLFQVLVFLLNAIFLSHTSKNLFYVFNFLFIGSNLYELFLQEVCHSGGKERKIFPDRQSIKEFMTTKPVQ